MVTSHDVARAAGVSQTTVSRVLSNSPGVRSSTKDRVLVALKQVGYAPNAVARAMRTQRTNAIGVVVSRISNPFYPQIVRQLGKSLADRGLSMTLWNSEGDGEKRAVEAVRGGSIDGLIFTTATADSEPLQEAIAVKAPVVLVNRVVEHLDCNQVASSNHQSGSMVANYFLQKGHRQIGLVVGPSTASTSREREAGFTQFLKEAGYPLRPDFIHRGDFEYSTGYDAVRQWFGSASNAVSPTALFCVNDLIAFGALDAAKLMNIEVPGQLSVVGHDDIEMSEWQAFSLSTVRQPLSLIIDTALELLTSQFIEPSRPKEIHRFPSQLVLRRSSEAASPVEVKWSGDEHSSPRQVQPS